MKALLVGVALMALSPSVSTAQDRFGLRLMLTKSAEDPARSAAPLTSDDIAAAQKCLDDVRAGVAFSQKVAGRPVTSARGYPPMLAETAAKTTDCLVARGRGDIGVLPSMSIVTNHLLR